MKNRLVRSLPGWFVLLPGMLLAQNVPLLQDAYFITGNASNFGSAVTLNVAAGATPSQALVEFDLSTLPANSTIAKATLTLFVDRVIAAGTVGVSVASGSWQEATVSGTNSTPVPGASVNSSVAIGAANTYISVDATTAVQNWVNGNPQNSGFIITPNTGVSVSFDSKESTTTSHPAVLSILLTGPAGATGPAGTNGAPGAPGANGSPGATGPQGTQGVSGNDAIVCPPAVVALRQCGVPQTFPVGTAPFGVAFDGSNIWVANNGSNTVTKLLASTGSTVGTYPVGANPFGTNPTGVAFDGTHIWVANHGGGGGIITELVASTGALYNTYGGVPSPYAVLFDGTRIWIADAGSTPEVTKIDSNGVESPDAVDSAPEGLAFDGTYLWVTNSGSSEVLKLQLSGSVVARYPTGSGPNGIAFDGTNMWVANNGSATVTKLNASTGSTVGTYPVGANPTGVAFDGTNIWVANNGSNTVTRLLASTGAVVATIPVGVQPQGVAFDGINIWVANQGSNTVTKIPVY